MRSSPPLQIRAFSTTCGRRRERRRARGAVLLFALLALIITTLIAATILGRIADQRAWLRRYEHQLQAMALVEAGLDRAAARLARSPDYPGETWEIPAEQLDGSHPASVRIEVNRLEQEPARRRITVEVSYPQVGTAKILERGELIATVGEGERS